MDRFFSLRLSNCAHVCSLSSPSQSTTEQCTVRLFWDVMANPHRLVSECGARRRQSSIHSRDVELSIKYISATGKESFTLASRFAEHKLEM